MLSDSAQESQPNSKRSSSVSMTRLSSLTEMSARDWRRQSLIDFQSWASRCAASRAAPDDGASRFAVLVHHIDAAVLPDPRQHGQRLFDLRAHDFDSCARASSNDRRARWSFSIAWSILRDRRVQAPVDGVIVG